MVFNQFRMLSIKNVALKNTLKYCPCCLKIRQGCDKLLIQYKNYEFFTEHEMLKDIASGKLSSIVAGDIL